MGRSLVARVTPLACASILALPWFSGRAMAQSCDLVRDINRTALPFDSNPSWFMGCGGALFFRARTAATGVELWRTDGTPGGTRLVKDINPGVGDSTPSWLHCIRDSNGRDFLVFAADDGRRGTELWASDGTAQGTRLVKDIFAGPLSSEPGGLVRMGRRVYFWAYEPSTGFELWRSDGTTAGTTLVKDFWPGFRSSKPWVANLNWTGTRLMVVANDGKSGDEVWCSDGTAAGTVMLEVMPGPAGVWPLWMQNLSNKTVFSATGPSGNELYETDCTPAGTRLLKDIVPGIVGSEPQLPGPARIGNDLYFTAETPQTGRELWKTDGTAAGTVLVSDIAPGSTGSAPQSLWALNGTLYFDAFTPATGRELFKFSGGTVSLVADLLRGPADSDLRIAGYLPGKLLLSASDGRTGKELWRTDGTPAGTSLVKDIRAGAPGSDPDNFGWMSGRGLVFAADDGRAGRELWITNGTTASTQLLRDIDPGLLTESSNPGDLTACWGDSMLLRANDAVSGAELWKVDAGGISLLADIRAGPAGSWPSNFTCCWTGRASLTFFTADDGVHGTELWITDGTRAGTTLVKDVELGAPGSLPASLVCCDGCVLFTADTAANGRELYVSDGTPAGTRLVVDIDPGAASSAPADLVALDGRVVFSASAPALGRELWVSDGTPAGTILLRDIAAGRTGSNPEGLYRLGRRILFAAADDVRGSELWVTDGTSRGTVLVADIRTGSAGSYPRGLARLGSRVLFRATTDAHGSELWVSDGTSAGTALVKDILPGGRSSSPVRLTKSGGRVFFAATDDGGEELFVTDGTAAGTKRVLDIEPGSGGSTPADFVSASTGVYFTAFKSPLHGGHGRELWFSDGTAGGTREACDVATGSASSKPSDLTFFRGALYFHADDVAHGRELFRLSNPGAHAEVLGRGSRSTFSTLESTNPVLGSAAVHTYDGGPSGHVGVVLLARPSLPYTVPGVFAAGACGLLDLSAFVIVGGVTPPSGTWSLLVPNWPAFVGARFNTQIWWVRSTGRLMIETSNGVHLLAGV